MSNGAPPADVKPRARRRAKADVVPPERQNRPRQVSELLPDVGRAAFRKFGFVQSAVVSRWGEIVGERYARISAPESIRFPMGEKTGGTLHLVVQGAHAVIMQHVTPEIVERVNRFFGYAAVAQVKFRQGDVAPPPSRKPPPSLRAASVELGENVRAIADPELLAVLTALAIGVAATSGAPNVGSADT